VVAKSLVKWHVKSKPWTREMAKQLKTPHLGLWEERVIELKAVLEHPNLSENERVRTKLQLCEAQDIAAMVNKYDPLKAIETPKE